MELSRVGAIEAVELGVALQGVVRTARTADNAAKSIVQHLYRTLWTGTGGERAPGPTPEGRGGLSMTPLQPAPLLRDHPLREQLNHEVHARPSESIVSPVRVSFLAMFCDDQNRDREWLHILQLAHRYGIELPAQPQSHLSVDFGPFRLRYERHGEFSRYKFIVSGATSEPFSEIALARVPSEWVEQIGGVRVTGTHTEIMAADAVRPSYEDVAARYFDGNALIGRSSVLE